MSSDKKIKKIFEKEGDELIRSKKEKILSDEFLNSVRSLPLKKNKKRYILKPALALAMMSLVVFGIVLAIPFFTRNQTTITPPDTSKDSITPPDTSENSIIPPSETNSPPAEFAWFISSNVPFAIIEIEEITDETISLIQPQYHHYCEYVKIKCNPIFLFRGSWSYSYPSSDDYIPFDDIDEIYVTKQSVDRFENGNIMMIEVKRMKVYDRYYYGPFVNDEGFSEFFSIVDGKLQLKEDDYNTFLFSRLEWLNDALDEGLMNDDDVNNALPKKKIGDGMTIDEIIEYFNAWGEARRLFDLKWDHTIPA